MSASDLPTNQGGRLIRSIIDKADADGESKLCTLVKDFACYVVTNEKSFLFFHWLPKMKRIEMFRHSGNPAYLMDEACEYFQWLLELGTLPALTIDEQNILTDRMNGQYRHKFLSSSVERPHPQPRYSGTGGLTGDGSIIINDNILSAKFDAIWTLAHEFFHDYQGECVKYKQHKKSDHADHQHQPWYEYMSNDDDADRYTAYVDAIWPTWYDSENPMSDEDLKKTSEYSTLYEKKLQYYNSSSGGNTGSRTITKGNMSGSPEYWAAKEALEEIRSANFRTYENAPHEIDARCFADEFLKVFKRKYRAQEHVIRSEQKAEKRRLREMGE